MTYRPGAISDPLVSLGGGRMNSPSTNDLRDAYVIPRDQLEFYRDTYINGPEDVEDQRFSPALKPDLADQPKDCVITCGFDPLRDEATDYAGRLKAAGVDVSLMHYPGQIHGFISLCKVIPGKRMSPGHGGLAQIRLMID